MPYLKIQTNQACPEAACQTLMQNASRLVADKLGKPESYVMVAMDPPRPMLFAGDDGPTAYLELKSIGLPANQTRELSAALCNLVSDELGVDQNRIYIEFADAARNMWGWNGATF
jgi:phenylpyruvate tautomerase PptA (4-oxalocrotonate tautomerase family)